MAVRLHYRAWQAVAINATLGNFILSTGNGADNKKRLLPLGDCLRERGIGLFEREILLAGIEAKISPSPLSRMVARGPGKHRIAGFEGIEDRPLSYWRLDFELNLPCDFGENAQMKRKDDADGKQLFVNFGSHI